MSDFVLPPPCQRPCISVHANPYEHAETCGICFRALYTEEGRKLWGSGCPEGTVFPQAVELLKRRPCHARHPSVESHPDCESCKVWENSPDFQEQWKEYVRVMTERGKQAQEIPCRHRGDLVPLTERVKHGLGTQKEWFKCGLGFGQNGFVCPCQGCNSMCIGYVIPDNLTTLDY